MLIKEVNIILHCAASIDFKAPMDLSVDQNVNGALRVLELAKECENLDVMNHVSTAYTGCHKVCLSFIFGFLFSLCVSLSHPENRKVL